MGRRRTLQTRWYMPLLFLTGLIAVPRISAQAPPTQAAVPPALDLILKQWEQKSGGIKRLRGTHVRYVYDHTFEVEKRSKGNYWYEAPDRGRIDIDPVPVQPGTPSDKKRNAQGEPFTLDMETEEKWICTGDEVLQIHSGEEERTYSRVDIPPSNRGVNIMDGPLPFLFGMSSDKLKARYQMSFGVKHSYDPHQGGAGVIHLVAVPLTDKDAKNWSQADVMLNPATFLPTAIRLLDPARTKETVYVFSEPPQVNEAFWLPPSPFKYSTRGLKLLQTATAPIDDATR